MTDTLTTLPGCKGMMELVQVAIHQMTAWLRRQRPGRAMLAEERGYTACVEAGGGVWMGQPELRYPADLAEVGHAEFKQGWERALADKMTW